MNEVHSGAPAVPSVPTETMHSALPAALPGQRTAVRLLDVIDQLTRHMQQLERRSSQAYAAPVAASGAETHPQELLALQRENATLKARQNEAKRRLEALLQRVEAAQAQAAHENAEDQAA